MNIESTYSRNGLGPVAATAGHEGFRSSEEWILSEEDKTTFARAAGYILGGLATKLPASCKQEVELLIKISQKAGVTYFKGKEINSDTLSTAAAEIITKNQLQEAIGKLHPGLKLGLKFSEMVDIFGHSLQNALGEVIKEEEIKNLAVLRKSHSDRKYSRADLMNVQVSLKMQGAIFAWGLLEMSALPNRVLSTASEELVESGKKYFKAYKECLRDLFGNVELSSVFPLLGHSQIHVTLEKMRQDAKKPLLRSATEQEEDIGFDIDESVEDSEPEVEKDAARTASASAKKQTREISYPMPNPYKPLAFPGFVGASFSISGGSGSLPQYTGQISFTVGPKDLPPPRNAPLGFGQPDPSVGGPYKYGRERIDASWAYTPVAKALEHYSNCCAHYRGALNKMNEARKSVESSNTQDAKIAAVNTYLQVISECKAALMNALEAAWSVEKLTCPHKVREYVRRNVPGKFFSGVNKKLHDELWNYFGVPRLKELLKEHLFQSSSLKACDALRNQAQHVILEANILKTEDAYNQAARKVYELEIADGTVDPQKLSEAICTLAFLGKRFIDQLKENGLLSASQIGEREAEIQKQLDLSRSRNIRLVVLNTKAQGCHKKVNSLFAKMGSDTSPAVSKLALSQARENTQKVVSQIEEFLAQLSSDSDKKACLLKLKKSLQIDLDRLSLAHTNEEYLKAYAEYTKVVAEVARIENADRPVDQKVLCKLMARL